MKDYRQIDDDIANKINDIGNRLYTFKYCLYFYTYCVEQSIYANSDLELACFGTILYEFLDSIKTKYNNLETELKI